MNESHVVLTLKEYTDLMNDIESARRIIIEYEENTDETFGVKYEYNHDLVYEGNLIKIPTFYTKKELNNEITEMFDTLQKDIERLTKENTQLKKPFWKRK